jgi:lipopolysaccharide export system permease protein
MAIRLRRGEPLSAFFLCFAPILVVYYPLLIFGINGAKNGAVPPISLWAGNLVLFVWGVWLLRKVLRY